MSSPIDASHRKPQLVRAPTRRLGLGGWLLRMPADSRGRRSRWFVAGVMTCCLMLAGCGYVIGPAFPNSVQTVYVPVIKSNSNRREIEYQLTEAVQREIKQRSGIRLAKPPYAQTQLKVEVVELTKNMLGETQFDDPRELQMRLAVTATWEDLRTGQILAQQQLDLAPAVRQVEATGEFTPELGHSMATANQVAVKEVAAKVVDLMEFAW